MREPAIRKAFHSVILKEQRDNDPRTVIDELGLKNGEVRADIAVIDGILVGYEIKTENDNLNRLPSQVVAYDEVFEYSYIIVSKNHLKNARKIVPANWGIYRIEIQQDDEYTFHRIKKAKKNKFRNCFSLAQLLWKTEALEVVNGELRNNMKASVTKDQLYDVISASCCSKRLSRIVTRYLKKRDNWRLTHQ